MSIHICNSSVHPFDHSRTRNEYLSPICQLDEGEDQERCCPHPARDEGGQPPRTMDTSTTPVSSRRPGQQGSNQYFSLRWNNYQSNITSVFYDLLETQSFVDVTLACEENFLKAHKVIMIKLGAQSTPVIMIIVHLQVVLSACSEYFQRILLENPCDHPTIILPAEIAFPDLQFIIEFVYRGEIDVSETELQVSG